MIKTLTLLRKLDHLSQDAFNEAWSGFTGTLPAEGIARCIRHEQGTPPPTAPGSPPLPVQVDGMEEIWFVSEAALTEFMTSSRRRAFLSASASAMTPLVIDERMVCDELPADAQGAGMLKRMVVLVRKEGWSHDQFIQHWVGVHLPLALKVAGGARRYRQLYPVRQLANPSGLPTHGIEIDGFSDSWFDDYDHLIRSLDVPGGPELVKDNRVYVQTSRQIFYRSTYLRA